MDTTSKALKWIETAWTEEGHKFADKVPVVRFQNLDVDDPRFSDSNRPMQSWILVGGKLQKDSSVVIAKIPYVTFSVDEQTSVMRVQLFWAGRCGYGFEITFNERGEVMDKKMCWIS